MSLSVAIYLLCAATGAVCAGLLARAYLRARTPLLAWTAISFAFLALSNVLLFADMVVFLKIDLLFYRQAAAALGVAAMLCGFIGLVR
ncbi:MAG: DUF5985 family protein [Caulobacteraceae bacterium]